MTLGFMQRFKWKGPDGQPEPTNFREKILAGVQNASIDQKFVSVPVSAPELEAIGLKNPKLYFPIQPKLHTIREDKPNRWKAGRKIEMVYRGAGYSIVDHFNKGIPELEKCVSVQLIHLWWTALAKTQDERDRNVGHQLKLNCIVDGKRLNDQELTTLAINDGFTSLDQFKRWFSKDFYGKIIHWTSLKY